ncbi:hypothetical protein A33Q_1227 [Indibacter alkaliphilus LW1]|uniref:Radical SAM core domain-containing protein n=1 Tax=Indibacter alkaliphilus (strain CCUG 57479 / KCTC 22604 / LW1) TaxID=1189612 RepID=S2E8H5_INDAL|nr:radical SAM protein [Indibacter alkaliphilus]EOZ98573.1 hypothetical protein A33Q_1227 [Indibacter alkaliphilus LW1]
MSKSILLLTPPFTQLNTPYPSTAYIKGYLNTIQIPSRQADLGINVILKMFSKAGLEKVFNSILVNDIGKYSKNAKRILRLRYEYLTTIEPVIGFLQFKNPTLAYNICDEEFLPRASRFETLEDLEWAFGTLGLQDKARHLATLYLEDLGDLIQECLDPNFGFSRYAERLGRSAVHFDPIETVLQQNPSFTDLFLFEVLEELLAEELPDLVCFSVPFPGNLYAGLRAGKYIKEKYPQIKIAMGGGYPNTELRSLKEPRVFKYLDFVTLDDGERPLTCLLEFLEGKRASNALKRTFVCLDGEVKYINGGKEADISFSRTGTPDYTGLPLKKYLSVIEMANPMHRLWSDGRWNKLTMAHGCYWKKCTFCDISLDYIKNYEPVNASILCDRIEELMDQTGETGFHFVDEAAPPALMRELAIEILKRKLKISWWTNIRFEERFTLDLCRLLKASGCIAVSGGLEVASDRLLTLMEKGVTVSQVARVAHNFTDSGIMVHAYLMYGFPTQTEQETIDSLEMVRQLFMNNVLQSGFWHLFAMTSHAPIGMRPEAYEVLRVGPGKGLFADNDLAHEDPKGAVHEKFSEGLKKSLFNFMHGVGYDFSLQEWFGFKIPRTTVPKNFIWKAIQQESSLIIKPSAKLLWLSSLPEMEMFFTHRKGKQKENWKLIFTSKSQVKEIQIDKEIGEKVIFMLRICVPVLGKKEVTLSDFQDTFDNQELGDFEDFLDSELWEILQEEGLVLV